MAGTIVRLRLGSCVVPWSGVACAGAGRRITGDVFKPGLDHPCVHTIAIHDASGTGGVTWQMMHLVGRSLPPVPTSRWRRNPVSTDSCTPDCHASQDLPATDGARDRRRRWRPRLRIAFRLQRAGGAWRRRSVCHRCTSGCTVTAGPDAITNRSSLVWGAPAPYSHGDAAFASVVAHPHDLRAMLPRSRRQRSGNAASRLMLAGEPATSAGRSASGAYALELRHPFPNAIAFRSPEDVGIRPQGPMRSRHDEIGHLLDSTTKPRRRHDER